MSLSQFEVLQKWDNNDLLDGVRLLLTVTEVISLTELFQLTKLAEIYRKQYPLFS
ncbi:hypothetical protein SAMN02745127_00810 [Oceanospirillum multiglobuliferum]|uniref:hypothetical protein n=1 Tax=Oceanospirillum multiglobuliferum TaxID=64969 RepID=UPI0009D19421|nr:hypothetical protein [Oceanospirillum multiglobuliferum]SJZ67330.1 hypothetical protein SAMN02745127_00810 [Oceanospirillum multiglobuliferum]